MSSKLLCILLIVISNVVHIRANLCPCEDQSLCKPVGYTGKEVFAFVVKANRTVWQMFDWTRMTTVALVGFYDPELFCLAHKNNVRVVATESYSKSDLRENQKIIKWIDLQIQYASDRFLDGINIDFEEVIEKDSDLVKALTDFVTRVRDRFHEEFPKSQVTFDVPWSPYNELGTGVDGRDYDFVGLANGTDFLFIMAYAERSQSFGTECVARANSGLYATAGGITAFLQLGIDPKKLVLGLPWYGYDYQCVSTGPEDTCYIKEVPFRGVNCSDKVGHTMKYVDIKEIEDRYGSDFDHHSQTPYIYIKDTNNTRQIWFDDSSSLKNKISFAIYKSLRGIGVWDANMLDYSGTSESLKMIKDMWGTFPNYKSENISENYITNNENKIFREISYNKRK